MKPEAGKADADAEAKEVTTLQPRKDHSMVLAYCFTGLNLLFALYVFGNTLRMGCKIGLRTYFQNQWPILDAITSTLNIYISIGVFLASIDSVSACGELDETTIDSVP